MSPSQSVNEIILRIETYFEFGIKSVWLVQPLLKQVAVFTPELEPHIFSQGDIIDPILDVKVALEEIFS